MIEIDTSTGMMIAFVSLLTVSIWKIYDFLPNKQLADDDTTDNAQEELLRIVLNTIKKDKGESKTVDELYTRVLINEDFNKEKYWRFSAYKLKKILDLYYLQHPETSTINDIHVKLSS